jgi:hypothetical protein
MVCTLFIFELSLAVPTPRFDRLSYESESGTESVLHSEVCNQVFTYEGGLLGLLLSHFGE